MFATVAGNGIAFNDTTITGIAAVVVHGVSVQLCASGSGWLMPNDRSWRGTGVKLLATIISFPVLSRRTKINTEHS